MISHNWYFLDLGYNMQVWRLASCISRGMDAVHKSAEMPDFARIHAGFRTLELIFYFAGFCVVTCNIDRCRGNGKICSWHVVGSWFCQELCGVLGYVEIDITRRNGFFVQNVYLCNGWIFMQKWWIFIHRVFHRVFHRLWVFNRFSTELSTGLVNSCLPTIGKIWKKLAQFWTVRILTILQGLSKSLHFQAGQRGSFSIFRRAAAGVDGPCRCSSTSPPYFNPSPYTNNSQLLLSPTSPFPSHHSIPDIAPSQLPFHYAILTHPPLSPPSHPLSAYRFHQIHSRTTSSIGVFFIPFFSRFSSIVENSYPFRSDSLSFIPCQYCFL